MYLPTWCNKKIDSENFVDIPKWKNIKISIKGKNNNVSIPQDMRGKMKIKIHGNDNKLIIKSSEDLDIRVTISCSNATVEIGKGTNISGASFTVFENNSSIKIGEDCMFSKDIEVWCSDAHSICDKDGQIINVGRNVEIGNHVWIGRHCYITKNTKIADNSVVGWCSNVTRKFDEPNVIIAGNPAQIVKRNINWRRERPQNLLDEQQNAE